MKSILKGISRFDAMPPTVFVWSDGSDARLFPICGSPNQWVDTLDYEFVPTSEAEALAVLKHVGLGGPSIDSSKISIPEDEKLEAAFEKAMTGRLYGPEETADAFYWFKSGWYAEESL